MTTQRRRLAADAWGSVLQVHAALVPYLDRQLQSTAGLPLSWYDVLLELSAAPEGRLRMSDLAERVVLSRTRVSRLIDELAEAGLVAREQNPDDKRSSFTVLTKKGRVRFKAAAPLYLKSIQDHFAVDLSDTELKTITRALQRVLKRPLVAPR